MRLIHVIGPPGTGKTTYLARQAGLAAQARGSDSVTLASLTKAAAAEIGGRKTGVPEKQQGTLHSLCFRAIGAKKSQMLDKNVSGWNDHIRRRRPDWQIGRGSQDTLDEVGGRRQRAQTEGEELRDEIELLRHRMVPREAWPSHVRPFARAFEEWRREAEVYDFTDLIEQAVQDVPVAPGEPDVLIGDEAQDWSRLEAHLFVDRWGRHVEDILLAGDPDQVLFEWRGANPAIFHDRAAVERVLHQSYRVPRRIHACARSWIRQIRDRKDFEYLPRDAEGEVLRGPSLQRIHTLAADLERWLADGKTVMLLAADKFKVNQIIGFLTRRRIPFQNAYRRTQTAWNPLYSGARERKRYAIDHLLAYLRPQEWLFGDRARVWNAQDLRDWMEPLRTKDRIVRGAKKKLKDLDDEWAPKDLVAMLTGGDEAAIRALEGDLDWWWRGLAHDKTKKRTWQIVYDIALRAKQEAAPSLLLDDPLVTVGTIHSVKGGESDVVVVWPDLSRPAYQELRRDDTAASVYRVFYVAMTRARETLMLGAPSTRSAVRWL